MKYSGISWRGSERSRLGKNNKHQDMKLTWGSAYLIRQTGLVQFCHRSNPASFTSGLITQNEEIVNIIKKM